VIQQNYQFVLQQHMDIMRAQKEAVTRENMGMIPAGGTLIGVDFYVPDPNNPERTRRARIPYDAVEWLVKRLDEQAGILQLAEEIPEAAIATTQDPSMMGGSSGPSMQDPSAYMSVTPQ